MGSTDLLFGAGRKADGEGATLPAVPTLADLRYGAFLGELLLASGPRLRFSHILRRSSWFLPGLARRRIQLLEFPRSRRAHGDGVGSVTGALLVPFDLVASSLHAARDSEATPGLLVLCATSPAHHDHPGEQGTEPELSGDSPISASRSSSMSSNSASLAFLSFFFFFIIILPLREVSAETWARLLRLLLPRTASCPTGQP